MSKMRKPEDLTLKDSDGDEITISICEYERKKGFHFSTELGAVCLRSTKNADRIIRKLAEIKKWMESK